MPQRVRRWRLTGATSKTEFRPGRGFTPLAPGSDVTLLDMKKNNKGERPRATMQHEQHIENEPPTAKPASRNRGRTVDPWDRWSVKSRFVKVNLTDAGNHVYDCVDEIPAGKRNPWVTVDQIMENDPANLKDPKRVYKGIHDCVDHGFMAIQRNSASSTAALRVRVIFNPGRGTANGGDPRYDHLGPVAPGVQFYDPLKAPAAKKRKRNKPEKVTDADGHEVIVHEPQPRCLAMTKAGSQCPAHAKAGSDLCGRHDQLRRQKVTTPPVDLSGGTPLSPVSELPTPPPVDLVVACRSIRRDITTTPPVDSTGGTFTTGKDGREGRTESSDRKAVGLSTSSATESGTETLVPVGDGQVVSIVPGELSEGDSVSNNLPEIPEMSDTDTDDQSAPGTPTVGHFRRHPESLPGWPPTATEPCPICQAPPPRQGSFGPIACAHQIAARVTAA